MPPSAVTAGAPVAAEDVPVAAPAEPSVLAQDTETADQTEQADQADGAGDASDDGGREVVAGLVAIVLLAVTIGAHALYRDRR